jgi:hypothetical protein
MAEQRVNLILMDGKKNRVNTSPWLKEIKMVPRALNGMREVK